MYNKDVHVARCFAMADSAVLVAEEIRARTRRRTNTYKKYDQESGQEMQ